MDAIKIVLAGQPNVGKSMLINAITHSNAMHVGNFSGVTVDKTEICFEHYCHQFELVDLPGTYSIRGYSQEEKVARDYLIHENYDVILNVLDSTHLQRNLLLTLELLKLNKKMVLALNMADEAEKEGLKIDVAQIEKIVGVPVILVSANTNMGIDDLLHRVHEVADHPYRDNSNILYSNAFEEEIIEISQFLKERKFRLRDLTYREMAIRILIEDKELYKELHDEPIMIELQPLIIKALHHLYTHHDTKNISEIKANEYLAIARGIRMETVKCQLNKGKKCTTKQIDDIMINKYLGVPIFFGLMWGLFQLTFSLGEVPMGWIESLIAWFSGELNQLITHPAARSLIVDGIVAGVGAVLLFLPNIIILFLGIALLETTGYMSRVSFLLDGFFHKFGLHGKSFIPLVTGFGCSVPAYMAARTLKSEKDRLITLFIIGFMSCGAKLPVYVLFVGTFFPTHDAGTILFLIYISGAILGLVMAKALRVFVFKGEDEPFVMEMPKYRMPSFSLIWHTVSSKAWSYLKKAGTFILAASMVIWYASNYPKSEAIANSYQTKIVQANGNEAVITQLKIDEKREALEYSYLGRIGKVSEPLFAPLGFDWQMTVALETGLAAKEVVVSTLGVLYAVGDSVDEESSALRQVLFEEYKQPEALAFIVFIMIYLPCFAASMVFAKEAGGYKYLLYLFIFTTVTAWILSFVTYRVSLGIFS